MKYDAGLSACFGKQRFVSKATALDALRRMKKDKRKFSVTRLGPIRPYRCRQCDGWHFGRSF